MPLAPPEKLPAILFVDDEPKTCKHFKILFSSRFRILTAPDGISALETFKKHLDQIGIIMTDQRMPLETGTEFLEKAALLKPSVKRILSTAYADVDAAVDAVNNGGIYRYITKPWEISELEMTLIRAMELYLLEREREFLLSQKHLELAQLAAIERVQSLATLTVFRNANIRNVVQAIGALFELGNPSKPEIVSTKWGQVYQSHRQFVDLVHATLPTLPLLALTLDMDQSVPASEFVDRAARELPPLRLRTKDKSQTSLPGPADSLHLLFQNLVEGLTSILPDSQIIDLHLTPKGPALTLPSTPIEQSILPIFSPEPVSEEVLKPCLKMAAALFTWHHLGGQIKISRADETLTAHLHFQATTNSPNSWQSLASDLIGNFNFWNRQL